MYSDAYIRGDLDGGGKVAVVSVVTAVGCGRTVAAAATVEGGLEVVVVVLIVVVV